MRKIQFVCIAQYLDVGVLNAHNELQRLRIEERDGAVCDEHDTRPRLERRAVVLDDGRDVHHLLALWGY